MLWLNPTYNYEPTLKPQTPSLESNTHHIYIFSHTKSAPIKPSNHNLFLTISQLIPHKTHTCLSLHLPSCYFLQLSSSSPYGGLQRPATSQSWATRQTTWHASTSSSTSSSRGWTGMARSTRPSRRSCIGSMFSRITWSTLMRGIRASLTTGLAWTNSLTWATTSSSTSIWGWRLIGVTPLRNLSTGIWRACLNPWTGERKELLLGSRTKANVVCTLKHIVV